MNQRFVIAAVVLPILGLLGLIVRAQLHLRQGAQWEVKISGYDPRDLLSGHYLRYQYQFDIEVEPRPDACSPGAALDPACCLCLSPRVGTREPRVQSVLCDAVEGCSSWLYARDVIGEQRYFIPAERATELEAALRERAASLRVAVSADGTLAVDTLLLDGAPWQETLAPRP